MFQKHRSDILLSDKRRVTCELLWFLAGRGKKKLLSSPMSFLWLVSWWRAEVMLGCSGWNTCLSSQRRPAFPSSLIFLNDSEGPVQENTVLKSLSKLLPSWEQEAKRWVTEPHAALSFQRFKKNLDQFLGNLVIIRKRLGVRRRFQDDRDCDVNRCLHGTKLVFMW